ncbi:MAG TPA: hypothetical protein VFS44_07685 [Gemmatimonadaceae bacterium]|nr:hypothetical protein [Gemmatimonadaceae bacterium]
MRILFLAIFILGLVLGVVSMIAGIDRDQRRGRWVKYVNLPIAGVAATLFGLVGYPLAKYSALGAIAMVGIAAAVAIAGGIGMMVLIAGWAVPSAQREVTDERYVLQGHLAHVTRAIGPDGAGEITYEHEGVRHRLAASSLDGKAIAPDVDVVIERVEDGVAYVELWSTIEEQLRLPS